MQGCKLKQNPIHLSDNSAINPARLAQRQGRNALCIPACNNCRLSNVVENIHEAKVLKPITAFGGIT